MLVEGEERGCGLEHSGTSVYKSCRWEREFPGYTERIERHGEAVVAWSQRSRGFLKRGLLAEPRAVESCQIRTEVRHWLGVMEVTGYRGETGFGVSWCHLPVLGGRRSG